MSEYKELAKEGYTAEEIAEMLTDDEELVAEVAKEVAKEIGDEED